MGKQTLTQWFPADVKPVHVGVYEVTANSFDSNLKFSYWNGHGFGERNPSVNLATKEKKTFWKTEQKYLEWRGLAVKP